MTNPHNFPNPYQSPGGFPPYQGYGPPPGNPPVWKWYLIYCGAMTALYVFVLVLGVGLFMFGDQLGAPRNQGAPEMTVMGILYAVLGAVLALMYVAPFVLPRSKAAWIYGFITIGIGFTSCCTLPASIPLIIFWLKPETKAFFRVS